METYQKTLSKIKHYQPQNEVEEKDKALILQAIKAFKKAIFKRETLPCHISASAIVLNYTYDKVLFAYHNIYQSYGWLGGHADGVYDLAYVAKKELKEESSLDDFKLLYDDFISLEVLNVDVHLKNNKIVPAHLHLNFTYAFLADEKASVKVKPDENSSIKWIPLDQLDDFVSEKKMIPIYNKILKRLNISSKKM